MPTTLPAVQAGHITRPDGASISYEVVGKGPALVFAHGMGGNLLSWWQQVPAFALDHKCVTLSQRGFGASSGPSTGSPQLVDFAGDVVALMDHLAIDQAVFIGQSMGGWTGVELTLAHPDRVLALVLSCTTGSLDYDCYGSADVLAWRAAAPNKLATLNAANVHRGTSMIFAHEQPHLHFLYNAIDRLNDGLDRDDLVRQLGAMRTKGPQFARQIECPVLCITGELDLAICPAGVHLVAAQMPNARVVEVPDTGHSVYFERASVFNAELRDFLGSVRT